MGDAVPAYAIPMLPHVGDRRVVRPEPAEQRLPAVERVGTQVLENLRADALLARRAGPLPVKLGLEGGEAFIAA
ncbi:MAG: hypothetical protein ACRYG8_03210 [Janthinobacterium lividum]